MIHRPGTTPRSLPGKNQTVSKIGGKVRGGFGLFWGFSAVEVFGAVGRWARSVFRFGIVVGFLNDFFKGGGFVFFSNRIFGSIGMTDDVM